MFDDYADDYVPEDRRRLIGLPSSGAREMFENQLLWFEMGDGKPIFTIDEVIEVRGDRLALARLRVGYHDGAGAEVVSITQVDETVAKIQRDVRFDLDDVDVAIVELDRMHLELGGKEP